MSQQERDSLKRVKEFRKTNHFKHVDSPKRGKWKVYPSFQFLKEITRGVVEVKSGGGSLPILIPSKISNVGLHY